MDIIVWRPISYRLNKDENVCINRIFQQPFSWKGLGVDVRGRSSTLKVNYRTSHQIRQVADRLVPSVVRDVDGLAEVSVFNGPAPTVAVAQDEAEEGARVAAFLGEALADRIAPSEIGIFVRSSEQLSRARAAAEVAGRNAVQLSEHGEERADRVSIGTMHLAKGLEFKAVVVMACDDEVLPLQAPLEAPTRWSSRRSTRPSGTFFMSPARVRATGSW